MVKVEKLSLGMKFKNYPALCECLEVECKKDNSRKSQIKEFQRYFDFFKDGQQIIITNIYSEPRPREDGRSKPYNEFIQVLLMDLINNLKPHTYTTNQLIEKLEVLNKLYFAYRRSLEDLSTELNVDYAIVKEFYKLTHNSLQYIVEKSLNTLQNKALLYWDKIIIIVNAEGHSPATDEQITEIVNIEGLVLKEMNFDSKRDVFTSGQIDKFERTVKEKLLNNDIYYYYKVYRIIPTTLNDRIINEQLKLREFLTDIEKEFIQESANTELVLHFQENAKGRVTKVINKCDSSFGKSNMNEKEAIRLRENYLKDVSRIVQKVIKK